MPTPPRGPPNKRSANGQPGGEKFSDEPEQPKYRYSTANMNETNSWKKWLYIVGAFLFFILIMLAFNAILNHYFFNGESDNGPLELNHTESAHFPADKQEIDSACGRATFSQDDGALCKERCVPQFFKCCDPFDEFALYNYTAEVIVEEEVTNVTLPNIRVSSSSSTEVDERNVTFLDAYDDYDDTTCSFDTEIRGCMSYAKCQALAGQIDPAPANLPDMCSVTRLDRDAESCRALCRKLDCCYSQGSDNCMAEKFDLCMDYAPCQNLRKLEEGVNPDAVLETAPRTLDYECLLQQPSCHEKCMEAECCMNPGAASCYQYNFVACLTYSPCTAVTETKIEIAPQFSAVPQPPAEIIYACNAGDEPILEPSDKTCSEICLAAECCFAEGDANCFHDDPLGCLAWDAQCQKDQGN